MTPSPCNTCPSMNNCKKGWCAKWEMWFVGRWRAIRRRFGYDTKISR
jgi:hypothetical protein